VWVVRRLLLPTGSIELSEYQKFRVKCEWNVKYDNQLLRRQFRISALNKVTPSIVIFAMGHAGASRKSPDDAPWETLSPGRTQRANFCTTPDSCPVIDIQIRRLHWYEGMTLIIMTLSSLLIWSCLFLCFEFFTLQSTTTSVLFHQGSLLSC